MKIINKTRMLLLKGISFLAITLFSVLVFSGKVNAAPFKYSDFNWEEFLQLRNEFWTNECRGFKDISVCREKTLSNQEEFYTKLYKLLAKYEEKKNLYIDDSVIVATIFTNIYPNDISNNSSQYEYDFGTSAGYFQIGNKDVTDNDVEEAEDTLTKYFESETDTLQLLIKSAISYQTTCYGVLGEATRITLSDGSSKDTCPDTLLKKYGIPAGEELYVKTYKDKNICAIKEKTYSLDQWQYLINKFYTNLGLIFKNRKKDKTYLECEQIGQKYEGNFIYEFADGPVVDYNRYFDFLLNNDYFDGKPHLQEFYEQEILKPTDSKCMKSSQCGNDSVESKGLYEQYYEQIQSARLKIISRILDSLNRTGTKISYEANTSDYEENGSPRSQRKSFYWPIGSDETEEKDGKIYAKGEPAYKEIVSYYGTRTSVTGEMEQHYGIDIKGENGKTNVISAYSGEVVEVITDCTSGDYTCNGGYGNSITISHSNGDYTVYGGLASVESNITVGTQVKTGELIGKVGTTGNKNTESLIFEIRVGGNDITYAIDPTNYVNPENPRPAGASNDFSVHETSLTKEEFVSKLKIYCTNTKCSSGLQNVMVNNAEEVYTVSLQNNVNPEFVVLRAISEGFSPGTVYYNYWGIGCTNGARVEACTKYSSLADGIRGLAGLGIVRNNETALEVMIKYAYIGKYWFNYPGEKPDWGLGGCPYYPYIKQYMSPERSDEVAVYCTKPCYKDGSGQCVNTTAEDQVAYATWQVQSKMGVNRHNIFGL